MLFRRKHQIENIPAPVTDPVIDAQIHWLGNRGLVVRDGLSKEQWIAAAEDPSDPISLAQAMIDEVPCCQPDPAVTIEGTDLILMVHNLADGLALPIDDVESVGNQLKIRSATTHLSFEVAEHHLETLRSVAEEFVDPAHRLIVTSNRFAIAHRDISEQVESVMARTHAGS